MTEQKFYTVAEVAAILVEKGIIGGVGGTTVARAGEEQVRRWIRKYQKAVEEGEHINNYFLGIKAEKPNNSKKKGFLIENKELERFIKVKTNDNTIIDHVSSDVIKEICDKYVEKHDYWKDKMDFSIGFESGFYAAIDFLRNKQRQVENPEKQIVKFPAQYAWYLKEEEIELESISESGTTNARWYVVIKYKSMSNVKVTFTLKKTKLLSYAFKTEIDTEYGFELSRHNKNKYEKLWKVIKNPEDKEQEQHNIEVKQRILNMLDIIQKKAEEKNDEQKLALMFVIDEIKPFFEVDNGGEFDAKG